MDTVGRDGVIQSRAPTGYAAKGTILRPADAWLAHGRVVFPLNARNNARIWIAGTCLARKRLSKGERRLRREEAREDNWRSGQITDAYEPTFVYRPGPMGNAGSAYARLRKAILTKNLTIIIDAAASEVPVVPLKDALRILVVMAEKHDERYGRAAARWVARLTTERRLGMDDTRRALALLDALPAAPEAVALTLRAIMDDR